MGPIRSTFDVEMTSMNGTFAFKNKTSKFEYFEVVLPPVSSMLCCSNRIDAMFPTLVQSSLLFR